METSRDIDFNFYTIINTARSKEAINKAVEEGFWPIIKLVVKSPKINSKFAVFQDKVTGAIEVSNDFRHQPNTNQTIVIGFTNYYPYEFELPYAAYLIPKDLKPGSPIYIADLIEDIPDITWNQGDCLRLGAETGVWNGKDIVVDKPKGQNRFIVG